MAKPLKPFTAKQLARARVLRDQRMSWQHISADPGVRCNKVRVRNALVAEGYPIALGPVPICAAAMQEMHDAYMTEDLDARQSLGALGKRYGVDKRRVADCVIAMGGTIRGRGTKTHVRYTRWGADVKCAIGAVTEGVRPRLPIGSYYCVGKCDWHDGMCEAEVTGDNRQGFAAFLAHLAENERKIAADRKYLGKAPHRSKAEEQAVRAREMRGERDE